MKSRQGKCVSAVGGGDRQGGLPFHQSPSTTLFSLSGCKINHSVYFNSKHTFIPHLNCPIHLFYLFFHLGLLANFIIFFNFLKRFYLFFFKEKGREGERQGEKHQCVVASHMPPTGDLAHNLGMCPDWESNQ